MMRNRIRSHFTEALCAGLLRSGRAGRGREGEKKPQSKVKSEKNPQLSSPEQQPWHCLNHSKETERKQRSLETGCQQKAGETSEQMRERCHQQSFLASFLALNWLKSVTAC
uniref:Uncharacterized protein n=1 Tax=Geospiza parvula TaxID=87175 RepID=A0A8C3NPJ6_GEOPR